MRLNLPPLPSIRDVVKLYRLQAVKQLSQNFLLNDGLVNKIVKQAGKIRDGHVVEVGPGPGGITKAILLRLPRKLSVVEYDRRFEPVLDMFAESYAKVNGKMEIMYKDVLRTDMSTFLDQDLKREWKDQCPNIHIIGNLPFNISTPLIIKWLHAISERRNAWALGRVRMTLTFQKEVAERIVAPEKDLQRCRLSIMAQAWTEPELKLIIPGKAFVPAPDVDVGVVTFTPLITPRTSHNFKLFEKITRELYSFRQKHISNCIKTILPPEYHKSIGPLMFKMTGLNPQSRITSLSVEDFDNICSAYKYICEKHPEIALYNHRASRRVLSNKMTTDIFIQEIDEEDSVSLEGSMRQ